MRTMCVLTILALAGGIVAADEVTLKSGGKVIGIATEKDGKVVVETGIGTVTLNKTDVLTIKKGRTPLHEYRDKLANVSDSEKALDHFDLAMFAKANGLGKYVRPHLQRAIELDPDHEAARRALGYQLYKGRWLTKDEVYRERGFVKFEGKWMTQAEVELIRRHRLELEERKMAMKEERARRREEERQRRIEMQRAYYEKMVALEQQREMQRRHRRNRRPYGYGGSGGYGGYGGYGPFDAVPTIDVFDFINGGNGINPFVDPFKKK